MRHRPRRTPPRPSTRRAGSSPGRSAGGSSRHPLARPVTRRLAPTLALGASLALVAGGCVAPAGPGGGTTTTTAAVITPGDPGVSDVRFVVTTNQGRHAISSLIYGINGATDIAGNRQTVVRMGGNRWTAYNWENNASNAGSDWCFQNDGFLSGSNVPGDAVKGTIDTAKANGAAVIVTVPIVDYVAADKNGGCDVRNSGANYLQTRFKQNKALKPTALSTTPNATDAAVYQDEYVHWLESTEGDADLLYSLDNEPDLWSATHAEVHPDPVTYAELAQRNIDYAKAVKRVAPTAKVLGPVNYGFYGFEALQGAPDAAANGNFVENYLARMKTADTANGGRLIDYLDLHWYPEATGGGVRITGAETTAAVVAARVQAPRSLWDPTYSESSWITTDYGYGPIRLIGRMKEKIATNYPGTGLAFTEWNFGGGDHISGAVASADVLGIFGREGVGVATMWPLNGNDSFTYAAFRAFRNFDGAGGHFGDTGVSATTSDAATGSVYASVDSANPNRVVVVMINKATTAKKAGLTVAHNQQFGHADVYRITAAGGANVVAAPQQTAVATNAFNYTMPAMSVSVAVLTP